MHYSVYGQLWYLLGITSFGIYVFVGQKERLIKTLPAFAIKYRRQEAVQYTLYIHINVSVTKPLGTQG